MIQIDLLFPTDTEWTQVSDFLIADSYTQTNRIMNEERESVVDTVTCELLYDRLLLAKFLASGNQKILFRSFDEEENALFAGYIAPNVKHTKDDFLQNISLEIRDMSWKLDVKVKTELLFPADISDPGLTVYTLFQNIILSAGYTLNDIDPNCINAPEVVKVFHVEAGKATYRQVLNSLLRSYGYVFTTTETGALTLYKWQKEEIVPVGLVDDTFSIVDPFVLQKQDEDYDGVKLSWTQTDILEDVCLFKSNLPVGPDGIPSGYSIAPGEYYPKDGDVVDIWQKYKTDWLDTEYLAKNSRTENQDISLLNTSNHRLVVLSDLGITQESIFASGKARILFHNPTAEPKKLFVFEIWGSALYRSEIRETLYPATSINAKDEFADQVYDRFDAEKLASGLYQKQIFGDCLYKFTLYKPFCYKPGAILKLHQYDTPINTSVVVLETNWNTEKPGTTYLTQGITEFGNFEVITEAYINSVVGNGLRGEPGQDAIEVKVFSSNGIFYKPGEVYTWLEARVFQSGKEITDQYPSNKFRWVRESFDWLGDEQWNSAHYSTGGQKILITDDDISARASSFGRVSFYCELI